MRCTGARLHHGQEGFSQSLPWGWLHAVILLLHRCFWLPKVGNLWSSEYSPYEGHLPPRQDGGRRRKSVFSDSPKNCSSRLILSSLPFCFSLWDIVREIKQTTVSRRVYFCCLWNQWRTTSESTKLTTAMWGLHRSVSGCTKKRSVWLRTAPLLSQQPSIYMAHVWGRKPVANDKNPSACAIKC